MRLSRFLAVPLFLSIAVAARADDPKTYDLSVKAVSRSARSRQAPRTTRP